MSTVAGRFVAFSAAEALAKEDIFVISPSHHSSWQRVFHALEVPLDTQAARFLSELQSCFVIVDELDLNTRIWTKE